MGWVCHENKAGAEIMVWKAAPSSLLTLTFTLSNKQLLKCNCIGAKGINPRVPR
jgi:hypothetical protein